MDLFRKLLMFICFIMAGTSLSFVGMSSTPILSDLIAGFIFAIIIVFLIPDIFRSKKKSI